MLFIKLSLKKKKKSQAASDRRRAPTSSLLTCSCTESDLSPPLPAGARRPCLVRSCAASVLVLLVTFDLWVSLVSVFLCLFLDLVVFCFCWLAGRGLGCRAGPAPAVWEGLCPPARPPPPPRPPQASRESHPCCPCSRMCVSGLGWSSRGAGETELSRGPPRCFPAPTLALGGVLQTKASVSVPTGPRPRCLPPAVFLLVSSQPARLRPLTPALFL